MADTIIIKKTVIKRAKKTGGTSETGTSETGTSETGTSETGTSETGTSETGTSETGTSETGAGKIRTKAMSLQKCFSETDSRIEIGVDEAGRGPMLGRVYTAAVILPKDASFNHSLMKDSKKFHSVKKIREAADYIKSKALYWRVTYADERIIEEINIRNATHNAMHEAITGVLDKINSKEPSSFHLLIDGNDFRPYMIVNTDVELIQVPHTCIEGGDNLYSAIAAASILAKVERDLYIEALCKTEPLLDERYGLLKNKGYGTKIHMDGIKKFGITPYHRKTFGICQQF